MTTEDLHVQRVELVQRVQAIVSEDLLKTASGSELPGQNTNRKTGRATAEMQ